MEARWNTRHALASWGWLIAPLGVGPVGWWLAYQPSEVLSITGLMLLAVELGLFLCAMVAVVVFIRGPFAALFRAYRRSALVGMAKSFVFLVSFLGGILLGRLVWLDRVERVVARGEPLVAAIHTFTAENGRPPESLAELVPRYIAAIPTTGIGMSLEFDYVVGRGSRDSGYDGNPWVLLVRPPCHPMGFDSLMYFPLQNYPATGYGGGIERVGKWGYVHE